MSDRIELRGLRALGTHGVFDFEQRQPQPFEIDLDLETDFAKAAASDDLGDAIDYGAVISSVLEVVEYEHFALLESLAEALATRLLGDSRLVSVTVHVKKLRPPVPADLASAGVVITRRAAR